MFIKLIAFHSNFLSNIWDITASMLNAFFVMSLKLERLITVFVDNYKDKEADFGVNRISSIND
jgi:hypothetical protein